VRFRNSQSLLSFERVLTRSYGMKEGGGELAALASDQCLISYIREALPWCSRPSSQGSSSWKTGVSSKKKRPANNSGFHLRILIDKNRGKRAPGNALTAPEDQRLAPQSPLRETAVAGDAQS
tara:strand:+ start:184 stop:549 length:366 start_codon:yes stop_codon:yes gene_type:complete